MRGSRAIDGVEMNSPHRQSNFTATRMFAATGSGRLGTSDYSHQPPGHVGRHCEVSEAWSPASGATVIGRRHFRAILGLLATLRVDPVRKPADPCGKSSRESILPILKWRPWSRRH